jgi:hypothetical protein
MNCMRVAGVVIAISVSMWLGCSSSDDTVVAANVQSSNDNQYNPTTDNGRKGGLLDPGIQELILNRASTNPTAIRVATKVRFTVSQNGQTPVEHLTVPAVNSWTVAKLDADGNPVKDAMGNTVMETHKGVGAYYDRFILSEGWNDGQATLKADALDAAGLTVLSATTTFNVVKNEPVYVPIDLRLPDDPALSDGGAGEAGEAGAGEAGGGEAGAGEAGAPNDASDGG